MSEFRELSKLPDDQAYWNTLEARITAELSPEVRSLPLARPDWWAPLAKRAWALGGLAAAAGLAALLLVPPRARPAAPSTGLLRLPDNPGLIAFVSAPEPPNLASLMIPSSPSER
jgi:hypothetical protein